MWLRKITHVHIPALLCKREGDVVKDTKLSYTFPSPSHDAWGAQREELSRSERGQKAAATQPATQASSFELSILTFACLLPSSHMSIFLALPYFQL